ncbi:hypothetical protein [uncultured Winogradskyella sp.]|uniref:hypothetical protein n=1 Tax=uncultured Winogradskyella sp. TaxID=395353 RepID=UPI0026241C7F|nr:hypothetical protein [uncultured Winogradskyella sp.]
MKIRNKILLLAFFALMSCPSESEMWERTYQVRNDTVYVVTIRAFESFEGIGFFEDVSLSNNEIYAGNKAFGSNFSILNDSNNVIPASSFGRSRFIVVFDDERFMIHSLNLDENGNTVFSEPINRNLLRGGSYTHIGNDFFEFVLTEEDYNNAIPCNGNCLD